MVERGVFLSLIALTMSLGCSGGDEVDGLTFESIALVDKGLGPSGPVQGRATLAFTNGTYRWQISDLDCSGSYSYDDGEVTAKTKIPCTSYGAEIRGQYDSGSKSLTWNGTAYRMK